MIQKTLRLNSFLCKIKIMGIIYIVLGIIVGGYIGYLLVTYVVKVFFFTTPAKKIEKFEEFAEDLLISERMRYELDESYAFNESDKKNISRLKGWYIRLKEKHKHNQPELVRLAEDWKDYIYNVTTNNSSKHLWLESGEEDDYNDIRESGLKAEEIENRFADSLGRSYREKLELERKKIEDLTEDFFRP